MSFPEGSNLRVNSQQKHVPSCRIKMIPAKLLYINEFPETRGIVVSDGLGLKKGRRPSVECAGRKVVSLGHVFLGPKIQS